MSDIRFQCRTCTKHARNAARCWCSEVPGADRPLAIGEIVACPHCAQTRVVAEGGSLKKLSNLEFELLPPAKREALSIVMCACTLRGECDPDTYNATLERLLKAKSDWARKRDGGELLCFKLPPDTSSVYAPLSAAIPRIAEGDEAVRDFLEFIDLATDRQATVLQLQIALSLVRTPPLSPGGQA